MTLTYDYGISSTPAAKVVVPKGSDVLLRSGSPNTPFGKVFAAWSLTEGGELLGETAVFTEDTTLYAVWGKEVLITYDANGGTGRHQLTQLAGQRIQSPVTAEDKLFTREGYKLVGWSLSADSSEPFDPSMLLTSNITLYAIWEPDDVVIRDEDSGVSVTISATEEAAGLALVAAVLSEAQMQSVAEIVKKLVQTVVEKTHVLDIYFVREESGERESVDGTRTVTVPIPEDWDADTTSVYYIDPDAGTAVDMHGTVSAGGKTISFTTSHFSYYALVQTKAAPVATATPTTSTAATTTANHSPKTGDDSSIALWLALMGVSLLAVGILLAKKKHFEK